MRAYETPELELVMGQQYLKGAKRVVVTLTATGWQKHYDSTREECIIDKAGGRVLVQVKQEDTGGITTPQMVKIQVSILTEAGARMVSDVAKFPLLWTAYEEVMA